MTKKRKGLLLGTALLLVAAILISTVVLLNGRDDGTPDALPDLAAALADMTQASGGTDYDSYIAQHADLPELSAAVTLPVTATVPEGESYTFEAAPGAVRAQIELTYHVRSDNDGDGACSLTLNGARPFREAAEFVLRRQWKPDAVAQDGRGNQYTVSLNESDSPLTARLSDSTGFHAEPFAFAFTEGVNTLTLTAERGTLVLDEVRLCPGETPLPYSEARAAYPQTAQMETAQTLTVEAELPTLRTNASIAEQCDRSSPDTTPTFTGLQVWNTVGGSGWAQVGQSASWELDVPADGCYQLAFRFKNNFTSGVSSYRRLLLDGKTPFAEMQTVQFPYGTDWQTLTLSDETGAPYLYSLTAGRHTLTLEATLGEQTELLNLAQKSLARLNEAYRKIILVTGANPDSYRDYQVAEKLPDVLDILREQREVLQTLADWMRLRSGKGEGTATVDELIWKIDDYLEYPETIPQTLSVFSGNLTSFSDWIQSSTSQPLTLDRIELVPEGGRANTAKAGFFRKLAYNTGLFFKSFADDYGVIGNVYDEDEAIEVWLTLGRDQYQILKEQIDNRFTPTSGIGANLKLVAGGILEATVAGIEPDVYLFADAGMPVNFASRGALTDLTQFPDYEQVASRFAPQASVPFRYDGGVYALPLSQSFLMLFTRDDILAEIGLEPPETWDDVYNCLTILQQNNMEFAFPVPTSGSVDSFAMLLFQNQQHFYKDGGRSVDLNNEAAIEAFEKWTRLYSEYSALLSYNFVNRFRSGDMPIGIVDFATFNTLEVSAPEISGLWSMRPVPATVREDGGKESISVGTSTAAMILGSTEHPRQAWEFLKWLTDEEEQYTYASAIENRQGVSGRFSTANVAAFRRLGWTASTLATIEQQRKTALEVEQVPGGYFLARHIDNIFRKIVNQKADVRETVAEYTDTINREIMKKRREFGLEAAD